MTISSRNCSRVNGLDPVVILHVTASNGKPPLLTSDNSGSGFLS